LERIKIKVGNNKKMMQLKTFLSPISGYFPEGQNVMQKDLLLRFII